jgi:hypothetical protein
MPQWIASLFSTGSLKVIGSFLSYGTVGLGLGLALFATALMLLNKKDSLNFLLFASGLVIIGAVLEFLKERDASLEAERSFDASQVLPDELWQDFLDSRVRQIFGAVVGVQDDLNGWMNRDEKTPFEIYFPKNSCRFFFVAAKPPAQIYVKILSTEGYTEYPKPSREYYKSGEICLKNGADSEKIQFEVQMRGFGGQFSVRELEASSPETVVAGPDASRPQPSVPPPPPSPAQPPSPPVPKAQYSKVACIGQYEGACPRIASHDSWIGCAPIPDAQIASQLCAGSNVISSRRLITIGGNRCGYALVEATCG